MSESDSQGLIAIAIAVIGGGTALYQRFKPPGMKPLWNAIDKINERLGGKGGVTEQLAEIQTTQNIYVEMVKEMAYTKLHSPTHQERDELLDKLKDESVPLEERKKAFEKFKNMIENNKNDPDFIYMNLFAACIKAKLKLK